MPYAFVQLTQTSDTHGADASLTTPNFGTSNTAGNLIFVAVYYDGFGGGGNLTGLSFAISDTVGNTYSPIGTYDDTNFGFRMATFYAKNIGAGTNAVKVTITSPNNTDYYPGILAAEYSGFDTTAPYTSGENAGQAQESVTSGTDHLTSGNTPTLSTQPAGVIGVSSVYRATPGPPTAGTGYTSRGNFWTFLTGTNFATLEDKRVTATTAVAATFTPSAASNNWITSVAVFKEAAVVNNFTLTAADGVYSLTGQSAMLGAFVTPSNGTYSIAGQAINFSLNSGSFVLPATAGMYSLLGGLSYADLQLDQGAGSYSFLGQPVNFSTGVNGFVVTAANGTYTLVGKSANIFGPPVSGSGHFLGLLGVGN